MIKILNNLCYYTIQLGCFDIWASLLVYTKVNVFKDPVTDRKKASKKGRLKLVKDSKGQFQTQQEIPMAAYKPDDPTVSIWLMWTIHCNYTFLLHCFLDATTEIGEKSYNCQFPSCIKCPCWWWLCLNCGKSDWLWECYFNVPRYTRFWWKCLSCAR